MIGLGLWEFSSPLSFLKYTLMHISTPKLFITLLHFFYSQNLEEDFTYRNILCNTSGRDVYVMEGQGQNKGKEKVKTESSGIQLNVLVVDDDRVTRKTHELLLKRAGVKNYCCVENGKEAVDLHCNGQTFDLILMDKDMPVMNGTEATKQLRSMGIDSKIVGVSSSRRKEPSIEDFMEAGLDDYYSKPFTSEMLNEILDKMKS
ncbi:Two-component response regulator ARR22, partial [Mucuna pruriens]